MEGASLCENKETIPPFSDNITNPVPSIGQSSTYNAQKRFRKPLKDITHLFNPGLQSTSALYTVFSELPFPAVRAAAPPFNLRKRKAIDDIDLVQQANSKSLRKNFR
ncbi:hypothetical protein HYC85_014215 [Camellia sinensis]|uniref:Uncharacterized protein n=1 Tax=Camellia sinensis TaxID=4442 RepID=A0A7J7H910_CAMSI|nr:hypothetical protein HYC85_014215 [Camellia sinensis]